MCLNLGPEFQSQFAVVNRGTTCNHVRTQAGPDSSVDKKPNLFCFQEMEECYVKPGKLLLTQLQESDQAFESYFHASENDVTLISYTIEVGKAAASFSPKKSRSPKCFIPPLWEQINRLRSWIQAIFLNFLRKITRGG